MLPLAETEYFAAILLCVDGRVMGVIMVKVSSWLKKTLQKHLGSWAS